MEVDTRDLIEIVRQLARIALYQGFVHPESSRTGSWDSDLIDTHTDSETDTEVNVI